MRVSFQLPNCSERFKATLSQSGHECGILRPENLGGKLKGIMTMSDSAIFRVTTPGIARIVSTDAEMIQELQWV